jgi:glycosyltransferase involved in cell wall biosynthesis
VHFLIPGDLNTLTGGYLYDRRIMAGLAALGWQVKLHRLSATFPTPDSLALQEAAAMMRAIADQTLVVIDGLALGGMPEMVAAQRNRLHLIALIHHPLALETGLSNAMRWRLFTSEREALKHVSQVLVTSASTARTLADYGVSGRRCVVVPPGTDPAPLAQGSAGNELVLLCVANLIPRKGHALLFRALALLKEQPWRLRCVGSAGRKPEFANALQALAMQLRLAERIEFLGELEGAELAACYRQADLFVLPSYHEGYGMALAEALAWGLPIVSTTAGAIPDTVPAEAGLLVAPGDVKALTAALTRVMTEPTLRQRLASGAQAARQSLLDWPTASIQFSQALARVLVE